MTEEKEFNLNAVQGFENFEQDLPKLQYLKIGNTKMAMENAVALGSIVTSNEKKDLAKLGKELQLIVVYMYTDYTIWKDNKMVAKAYTKIGRWSNGMEISPSQFDFIDGQKPMATEALNFVVIPLINGVPSIVDKAVLAYGYSNNHGKEMAGKAKMEIAETLKAKNMYSLSQGIYSVKVVSAKNKKGEWLAFDQLRFVSEIPDPKMLADASVIFNDVKDIANKRFDTVAYSDETVQGEYVDAELAESADTPY